MIRLKRFLAQVDVVFIGRTTENDIAKLKKYYRSVYFSVSNVVDIGTMAIHRGLATKKRGTTTLQALVENLGNHFFPKPDEIKHVNVFDIETPELSKDAQVYCAKDVEAPLLAYAEYRKLLNLALRMKPEELKVGNCVEIMTSKISDVKATICGAVVQISGATQNGINLSKKRILINVTEVFDSMSLVHFPEMSSGRRCKRGRKDHRSLRSLCDVTTLKYFGSVPFYIIETACRLRKLYAVDSTADSVEHEEVEISREKSAAAVPIDEAKYNDEDADNRNDEAELAAGSQYYEFDDKNIVNSNKCILCNLSIGDKAIQILDAEIDTAYQNSVDDSGLMESAYFGFEFHEIFAPVGISAGDAAAFSATDESIALVKCLSDTFNNFIANADAFAEDNKSNLETQDYNDEGSAARVDDKAHQKRRKVEPKITNHVLEYLFHIMERVKVLMHHDFKAFYFQALWAELFTMDAGDA